jgi:hypothetical protein
MIFLVGGVLRAETANACPSTETKITHSDYVVEEIPGTWPKNLSTL